MGLFDRFRKQETIVEPEVDLVQQQLRQIELENAMRELLTEPEKCVGIGQAAYERTRRYFDRTIMLENQRKDYIKLLGEQ